MFRLDSLILFGNIALICIPFTHSVILDIPCEDNTKCGGIGAVCRDRKCQCDTPFYTPCGTTNCDVRGKFVYEGDACRVDGNCMDNARCNGPENRCRCLPDYVSTNGLCYKNLNAHCMGSSECWPNECREKICQCRLGSSPREDNRRCRPKLPSIYPNWTLANMNSDFCYGNDQNSCLFRSAVCQSDSQYLEKFCQCPSTHIADYEKQECRPIEYDGLSPSIKPLPANPCGKCRVENAVCANVADQTTCWCQAGFNNTGNQCEKSGKFLIFPNQNDIDLRDYTSNCLANKFNGSCSCSPGQSFNDRNRSCQSIEPKWENDEFEYGVCTRINSMGRAVEEDGLCPHPLKCQARRDKYVCSCGPNRYLNEKNKSCHYYLEKPLTNPIGAECPLNSILNGSVCQCNPPNIFKRSNDSKHCELVLNGTIQCDVSNSAGDSLCEQFYGGYARFCRQGECRCQQNTSYDENNRCITLIGEKVGNYGKCPLNTNSSSGICTCHDGYRVKDENNRTCVSKVNGLNETRADLTEKDCKVLFPKQPIQLVSNSCQCADGAFFNGSMCVPYLHATFSEPSEMICPAFAEWKSSHCQCLKGYKQSDNKTCDRWVVTVYQYNDTTGVNTTGIKDEDCKALFGSAAEKSNNGDFCHCREANTSYFEGNKCYFLINTNVDRIDPEESCPLYSIKNNTHCGCRPGYKPKLGNRGCEVKSISTSKLQAIDIGTYGVACNPNITNPDCQEFFGAGAVCRSDQCYCDRKRSFVHQNRCALFSDLIFPGAHQRHLYACQSAEDCGKDAKKNGIDCAWIDENYRVCQCQQGYFFNPIDYTCVPSQCYPACSPNQICENYECVCPVGFYIDSSNKCVKFVENLKVHDGCNGSYWSGSMDGDLECDENCQRVRCSSGYEDDGSKCVKKTFKNRCFNGEDFCSILNPNSICDRDENRCVCGPDFYLSTTSETCIRAVGSPCVHSDECGLSGECSNKICVCKSNYKITDSNDHFGRKIQICINGMNQLRFDLLILLFVVIVRIFFA